MKAEQKKEAWKEKKFEGGKEVALQSIDQIGKAQQNYFESGKDLDAQADATAKSEAKVEKLKRIIAREKSSKALADT